jgi:hypothetical protein
MSTQFSIQDISEPATAVVAFSLPSATRSFWTIMIDG